MPTSALEPLGKRRPVSTGRFNAWWRDSRASLLRGETVGSLPRPATDLEDGVAGVEDSLAGVDDNSDRALGPAGGENGSVGDDRELCSGVRGSGGGGGGPDDAAVWGAFEDATGGDVKGGAVEASTLDGPRPFSARVNPPVCGPRSLRTRIRAGVTAPVTAPITSPTG